MAVARDDLRRDVLALQVQARQHARLELGARRRVRADRTRDRADGDLLEGALQAQRVALGLEGEAGQLHAERRRLGVHPMRTPDAQRLGVLARASVQRRHEAVGARHDHLADRLQLQRERRVEYVRGGQAVVDPAARLARRGAEHVDERRHVVVGRALALVDRLDREARAANRL